MKTPSLDRAAVSTTSRPGRRGVGLLLLATLGGCGAPGDDGVSPADTEMQSQAQSVTSPAEKSHAAAVASNGSSMLWAWPELVSGVTQIRLQLRDVNGNPVGGVPAFLTSGGSNKKDVTVAAGPDGKFLVAWEQEESTGTAIKGIVMQNRSGQLAASTAFLAIAPGTSRFLHPRAVFAANRSKFLVVFHQDISTSSSTGTGQIKAAFVSPTGAMDATFMVANVPSVRLSVPTINRIFEPEVAYATSTGALLVTMESFGTGSEFIFAATIFPGQNNADQPMMLAKMDGAAPVFNKTTNQFVVPMIDDFTDPGIKLATVAAGCRTATPSSCQITVSPTNVVTPGANSNFVNIAAAPLGSGVMVTTSRTSSNFVGSALSHFFFNSGMALIHTRSLGVGQRVFGTNSMAELSSTRAVAGDTFVDSGGNLRQFFITAAPSTYVTAGSF